MIETPCSPSPPLSIEEGVNSILCDAQKSLRQTYQECELHVRRYPTTSMLSAAAVGYCLHRLPVRALLVAQVRLMSALAPPALFLFGAAKLYEFLQKNESARHQSMCGGRVTPRI